MSLYTLEQVKLIEAIQHGIAGLSQIHPLSDEYYAQCLEAFENSSNQRTKLIAWLENTILSKMPSGDTSVLSIGCGTGAFDESVLSYLQHRTDHLTYVGIEPNSIEAGEFLQRMNPHNKDQIEVSVRVQKFDAQSVDRKFDLVLFVQSIYYMDDRKAAIDLALKMLKPGGDLVVIIAPDEALNAIANLIWQHQMEQKSWFSADLRSHFEERGLRYSETRVDATLNANDWLGKPSFRGLTIIDFIIQTKRDQLPRALADNILTFLRSISSHKSALTSLPHPADIFVCKAP